MGCLNFVFGKLLHPVLELVVFPAWQDHVAEYADAFYEELGCCSGAWNVNALCLELAIFHDVVGVDDVEDGLPN